MAKKYKERRIWTRAVIEWDSEKKAFVTTDGEWYLYRGPMALAHPAAAFDQDSYRWRDDDGTDETDATWLEVANTSHDFDVSSGNVDARLRIMVQEINGEASANQTFVLMFQINGGGYNLLTASSTGCIYYDSTKITDGNDTTEQMAGPGTFLTPNNGIGEDGNVGGASCDFAGSDDMEAEFTVRFVRADLSDGDSIDFQMWLNATSDFTTAGDPTAGGYTRTANATITKTAAEGSNNLTLLGVS